MPVLVSCRGSVWGPRQGSLAKRSVKDGVSRNLGWRVHGGKVYTRVGLAGGVYAGGASVPHGGAGGAQSRTHENRCSFFQPNFSNCEAEAGHGPQSGPRDALWVPAFARAGTPLKDCIAVATSVGDPG